MLINIFLRRKHVHLKEIQSLHVLDEVGLQLIIKKIVIVFLKKIHYLNQVKMESGIQSLRKNLQNHQKRKHQLFRMKMIGVLMLENQKVKRKQK